MINWEEVYDQLVTRGNLDGVTTDKALYNLGVLIDISFDLKRPDGQRHAIKLLEELTQRNITLNQSALSNYFLANAYSNLRIIETAGKDESWDWEQDEISKTVFHLRSAIKLGENTLESARVYQILTNLGNTMNNIGRFVEAIDYWDRVIESAPDFSMALANRGATLMHYAQILHVEDSAIIMFKSAYDNLTEALKGEIEGGGNKHFADLKDWIEANIISKTIDEENDFDPITLGEDQIEVDYRDYCLKNKLFLNFLNDISKEPPAAYDTLTLPSIVVAISEGPYYHGFFNQIKQEYVSARYIYYSGITADYPHFSDKGVLLSNTLDYPSYSLAVEKIKMAFRMVYSLLDKIAFFLNRYLNLSIPGNKVSFKRIWYVSQDRKKGLIPEFTRKKNWPLRGLFWLSKDLFENTPDFQDVIEPDAQEINQIRNHLEHKYLKLHEDMWIGPKGWEDDILKALTDTMAYSMYRSDFERKILRLFKLVRAALIYLSLAIHCDEQEYAKVRGPGDLLFSSPLGNIEDDWKV